MARRGLSEKELLLDARAAAWAGLRVVVADVETTGLNVVTSRVISIALSEIQSGRVLGGYASLVDPGLTRLGAASTHHLSVETLRTASAPSFAVVAPILLDRLSARGSETVLLAGHNVVFDALMLHAELTRLGQSLPPIALLDTKTLAARAGVPANSLGELAEAFRLVATDEHTAVSDAAIAAQALLLLTDKLRGREPGLRVEDLTTPFDPTMRLARGGGVRRSRKELPPLTGEHLAAHDKDLTNQRVREAALTVCLREDCVELVGRVEDGITTSQSAEQVAEWAWGQLDRDDLSRVTRGRLFTALAMTVGRSDDPGLIRAYFDAVTSDLPRWGPCKAGAQCDRCADAESTRLCRYLAVRYALIAGFLTRDNELDEERADAFIPYRDPNVKHKAGRPPTGWFGELVRAGDLDSAGYGAQLAAQAGARSRRSGREVALLRQAWNDGSRNAKLADQLSKRVLTTAAPDDARTHIDEALDICDQAIATQGKATGRVWDSLRERRARILVQKYARPRTPPATVRNKRPARQSRFFTLAAPTPPVPKAKARSRRASSAGR